MQEQPPVSVLLREAMTDLIGLVRSEIQLVRVELMTNVRDAGRESAKLAVSALLAVLGGLALLAATVIALGRLLNNSFGWSALIVGVLFLGTAGLLAYRAIKKIGRDTSLPIAKMNLRDDQTLIKENIYDISERIRSGSKT